MTMHVLRVAVVAAREKRERQDVVIARFAHRLAQNDGIALEHLEWFQWLRRARVAEVGRRRAVTADVQNAARARERQQGHGQFDEGDRAQNPDPVSFGSPGARAKGRRSMKPRHSNRPAPRA
jgi:hypothetical protein